MINFHSLSLCFVLLFLAQLILTNVVSMVNKWLSSSSLQVYTQGRCTLRKGTARASLLPESPRTLDLHETMKQSRFGVPADVTASVVLAVRVSVFLTLEKRWNTVFVKFLGEKKCAAVKKLWKMRFKLKGKFMTES